MTGYRPAHDDDRAARSLASRAWSRTPAELEGQAFLGKALVQRFLHDAADVDRAHRAFERIGDDEKALVVGSVHA